MSWTQLNYPSIIFLNMVQPAATFTLVTTDRLCSHPPEVIPGTTSKCKGSMPLNAHVTEVVNSFLSNFPVFFFRV